MSHRIEVEVILPEQDWIQDTHLCEKTAQLRALGVERSSLQSQHLGLGSPLLHVEDCKSTFMVHMHQGVSLVGESTLKIEEDMGDDGPVDQDILIAEVVLANFGEVLEYKMHDGKNVHAARAVCQSIAPHAYEGNLVKRTAGTSIVSHADFLNYQPSVKGLQF